jgi:hypothetical protein
MTMTMMIMMRRAGHPGRAIGSVGAAPVEHPRATENPVSVRRYGEVMASPAKAKLGQRVLDAVDEGVEKRWGPAVERAGGATGATLDERVVEVTQSFRRELGLAGAAAGGTAAVPGVGVATSTAAFVAELGWSTVRLSDLILTIAALHGHHDAPTDERRLWVLSILTYGDSAASKVARLAGDMGVKVGSSSSQRIPAETVRRMNNRLGYMILSRYGTRRGALALGRMVPFGIGAALGYGLNAYVVKSTARHAHRYFGELPTRVQKLAPASIIES